MSRVLVLFTEPFSWKAEFPSVGDPRVGAAASRWRLWVREEPREGRENPRKSICSFRLGVLCGVVRRERVNSQLSSGEGVLNSLKDLKSTLVFKLKIILTISILSG